MAEKRENSVLFSLRELQQIEEDRVTEEEDARRRAEEERIRAEMEAERQRREAEEAARRAEEERIRAEQNARERQQREEQLRLDEAERRARVEAQADLERQRLHQEMELKKVEASRSKPKALIWASAILVIVVAGLGVYLWKQSEERAAEKLRAEQELAELNSKIDSTVADIKRLNEEKDAEVQRLLAAKTEDEKVAAQRALDEKKAEIAAKEAKLKSLRNKGSKDRKHHEEDHTIKVKCDPSDPLCGI